MVGMSNAYSEARLMAREKAEGSTCFVPLSMLQDLLAEIDRLRLLSGVASPDKVISMKHENIKA